jgi:hypothetical protein
VRQVKGSAASKFWLKPYLPNAPFAIHVCRDLWSAKCSFFWKEPESPFLQAASLPTHKLRNERSFFTTRCSRRRVKRCAFMPPTSESNESDRQKPVSREISRRSCLDFAIYLQQGRLWQVNMCTTNSVAFSKNISPVHIYRRLWSLMSSHSRLANPSSSGTRSGTLSAIGLGNAVPV